MDVDFSRMLYTSARGLLALRRWDAAEEAVNNALKLRPDYPDALCLLAVVLWFRGDDRAISLLEQAISLDPGHAETLFYLAKFHLGERDYEGAREMYRRGIDRDPEQMGLLYRSLDTLLVAGNMSLCDDLRWLFLDRAFCEEPSFYPQWDGAQLGDRTLLVVGEGGYGDLFQICRYLSATREWAGGRVVLDVPELVAPLFRSCGLADKVVSRAGIPGTFRTSKPTVPGVLVDVQIGTTDLPLLLAPHGVGIPCQFPYLYASEEASRRWKERLDQVSGGAMKIGLRWAGNPTYLSDARRSAHLADFAPLAGIEGVHWFSLQKDARQEEVTSPPEGMFLTDLAAELTTFEETAAALVNLDLVISTDTAVPHLAAALGTPVWMALDDYPNNRWDLEGEYTSWYPMMRLFRQKVRGDWRPVFEQIQEMLQEPTRRLPPPGV